MSSDDPYVRVCPKCGGEFVSTVEVCFDCGAPLETRLADAEVDPAAAELAAAAPGEDSGPPPGWTPIQTADLDWALELKQRLAGAGIAARLAQDCASCRPTLDVYVAPSELDAANRVAQELYVEKVPEAAADAHIAGAADRCPACGAALSPQASSCPDCGLVFVAVDGADEADTG